MGVVSIDSLTKLFGADGNETVAVDDVDLEIQDGEFVVFVGPSGCGKTTTLRCIAGLEDVTSGEILINGEQVTDKKPKDRNIAMVFQNYALYPHKTARENMAFGLKMSSDYSSDEITDMVDETAETLGISDLLDNHPNELSGGQQQRVALGRAIVRNPEVFLLDEPLSNLDAKLRTQMRTELQSLQQKLDVTTIYVTHDQTEAMTMSDRIVVLNRGELQQVGTPLECYYQPVNRFVAGFIGSPNMNFFDVELESTGGTDTFSHELFEYQLTEKTTGHLEDARTTEFTLGIRPEDIMLASGTGANVIQVTVNVVETLGDVTYLYFQMGDETYQMKVSPETYYEEGDMIQITFPEDRIHVFDRTTGDAVKTRELPKRNEDISITV